MQFAKAVNHKDADQYITPGRPEDVAAKVAAGEADLGASSIPADAALEGVALSEPYLHADYAVVTKMDTGHDDLASIQDAGTVVAVQNDAAIAAWVAENLPEAEVVAFEDGIDALMELNSERAQAAIVDEPRFRRYVQVKEPHLQAVELVASDKDYAFAVAAGNEAQRSIDLNSKPDYREKLNEELREMRESEMWQAGAVVRKLRPENN